MAEGDNVPGGRGLKVHHLRPAPGARTARTRVGRGEAGKGKTAGRGTKGTRARGSVAGGFEGGQMPLHRRGAKPQGVFEPPLNTHHPVGKHPAPGSPAPGSPEGSPRALAPKRT